MNESSHQLAAIMFTDIVGYTTLMGSDEDRAFEVLRKNQEIHKRLIQQFNGTLIKEMGDGMLISFHLASDAVRCAIEIQKACKEQDIPLKIGIHEGEMVFADEDVYGDGVNIASRLQGVVNEGCIAISERVYSDIKNKAGIKTKFIGDKKLKNVDDPVKVYEVLYDKQIIEYNTVRNVKTGRLSKRTQYFMFMFIMIVVIAASINWYYFPEKPAVELDKSIAVLPLSSLSIDPENHFFADGIVEDLLHRLSVLEGFKVISRTSSEMYRERGSKSLPQIAKALGVSYIIEGSVQRTKGKVRINVQLIEAQRDAQIWSSNYDRDLTDIFKTQSDIALAIADELNSILTGKQKNEIEKSRTENIKAFEMYHLGRFYWNKRTNDGYLKSIEYFEQALAEDSNYGLAYAGLADTYNLMALQRFIDRQEGRDMAVELAKKAMELDSSISEPHNVLASIYTYIDFNWQAAEYEYLKAIEINPNYSTVHHYYSEHLSITGRHELAREQINKAIELDPLSFVIRYVSTKLYFHQGHFREALLENKKGRELSQNKDHRWIAQNDFRINLELGNELAAFDGFKRYYGNIRKLMKSSEIDSIYERSGFNGLQYRLLEITEGSYRKAVLYGYLGDEKKAMDWLEKGVNEKIFSPEFTFQYQFRNLHSVPRYQALLRQIGLSDIGTVD